MEDEQQTFLRLSAALAIGLLIGVERGWKEREAREGERVAGVRTYGLIGLLGGGMALLAERLGPLPLALAFVALAGVLTAAYAINVERDDDAGITSLVAGLLTFVFGALAALGQVAVAAASAVVTTLLLGFKPVFGEAALKAWLGEAGVLMLAGASGVAEVDAITLSLARMSRGDLAPGVAVTGLVIAAAANSVLKGAMAAGIGGRQLGLRVGVPLLAASASGLLSVWCLTASV